MSISNSTISSNTAHGGTGGSGVPAGLGGSAFGGGIEILDLGSQLLNDTVYGNTATGGSGSTSGNAYGGGIEDEANGATGLTIVNSTVAANVAAVVAPAASGTAGTPFGGGIDNSYVTNDPHLALYNTLDATNTAAGSPDFAGAAASVDDNFIGDGTGGTGLTATGSIVGPLSGSPINPLFAAAGLTNNGGNTQTVTLQTGSQALGAGDPAIATAFGLTTDQRGTGYARIVGTQVDIGAVETQARGHHDFAHPGSQPSCRRADRDVHGDRQSGGRRGGNADRHRAVRGRRS